MSDILIPEVELKYFKERFEKVKIFCNRFPNGIDFTNKRVLDIGCGHGALCFYAAQNGAREVVGIDTDEERIEIAKNINEQNYQELSKTIKFQKTKIEQLNSESFDIIVSQASFEHISDPASCLQASRSILKDKGLFYVGFSTLYNGPWGDHGFLRLPLSNFFPWAHLLSSQDQMIERYNKSFPDDRIESLQDLSLNGISYKEFIQIFRGSKFKVKWFQVNRTSHPLRYVLSLMRRLPGLKEYFSRSIYTILEK